MPHCNILPVKASSSIKATPKYSTNSGPATHNGGFLKELTQCAKKGRTDAQDALYLENSGSATAAVLKHGAQAIEWMPQVVWYVSQRSYTEPLDPGRIEHRIHLSGGSQWNGHCIAVLTSTEKSGVGSLDRLGKRSWLPGEVTYVHPMRGSLVPSHPCPVYWPGWK